VKGSQIRNRIKNRIKRGWAGKFEILKGGGKTK
jgi:hypothetical protein